MRALGLAVLGLVTTAAGAPASVGQRSEVTPFEPAHTDVVLPVRLNGRGPFRLLLDTGSTHSVVSPATAEAIAAPVVAKTELGSAAGSRMVPVVRVASLDVGPVNVRDLLASMIDLDEMLGGEELDGVIGHDVLGALRYTIDFRQRRVTWLTGDVLETRGSRLQLQLSSGRFLIALPQRESVLRLVPDTGAASLVLFAPYDMAPVTRSHASVTLKTMSGDTVVRTGRLRELRVGAMTLHDVPAVVAERDGSEPSEVDGLLPLHLFDRVTVDAPGKQLIVEGLSEGSS